MKFYAILPLNLLIAAQLLLACQSNAPEAQEQDATGSQVRVEHWGAMRVVLREGQTQGRISLAEVVGPGTIAVGALAGLAAEITIDGGRVQLAEVLDADSPNGLLVREPLAGEEATLLVLANVEKWTASALPNLPDLGALERHIRQQAQARGMDTLSPIPFRVEGTARDLGLHVLNRSCPIANPDGPQPWRFKGPEERAVLIGFYAENSAGKLTHHGQKSHVHAILKSRAISGHLDELSLVEGATLFLPSH
jgi:hypothetical protein